MEKEKMSISDRLEKALLDIIEREAAKTNATSEEMKALADIAYVLAKMCC